jgi:hypothetical protein
MRASAPTTASSSRRILRLSERQVRRLYDAYAREGGRPAFRDVVEPS